MEIGINDLSHAVRIMSGFEAYAKGETGSDVTYAKTCLRLNGLNLDSYKGTEGFIDSIKAGGKKMFEIIVKFLKAVKNFFFGGLGSKRDKAVKDAVTNSDILSKEILKSCKEIAKQDGETAERLEAAIKQTEQFIKERKGSISERKAYSIENWDKYISRFSDGIWGAEVRAKTIEQIPGLSLSIKDNSQVAKDVTNHLARVRTCVSALEGNSSGGMKSVDALQNFKPLLEAMTKVRDGAKTLLAGATLDLEKNNAVYEKIENKEYKSVEVTVRRLNIETAALIDAMTKLIAICERDIATIENGMKGIAKKIKIEDIPTSNLEEFERFMSE